MKAQILKIAGVKTEAEFYKKFPSEEAFMKKHGKELKKAQNGLQGVIKPKSMPKVEMVNLAKTPGFGLNKLEDIPAYTDRGFDYIDAAKKIPSSLAPQLGSIIGNIEQIEENKRDIVRANQWADISEVVSKAASSRTEQPKRRYVRPEDNLVTAANPLGKKDSLLAAQNGAEIANTFAPNTIYTDLGYEPLNDSNPKQYAHGGHLPKAASGFNFNSLSGVGGGIGGALGSAIGGGTGRGGAGSAIGSTIGGALGNLIPIPGVGSLIGSTLGGLAGGLFDANDQNKLQEAQDRQAAAISQATMNAGVSNLQKANKAFMEDGGYMNPEYNPQVIAKFGDYSMDQLLAPPADADMLRAGGHLKEYTRPSERAMYTGRDLPYQMEYGGQMAMGGDLEVHRGEAETLSYNPFLPDGGETIMFRGPSHDDGGMPISYGENGVEVEGGEPAVKLEDGGSPDGNLVVYGNMIIPDYGVAELGDKNAKGKKFKHYIADLSKVEAKQGKIIEKTTDLINNTDTNDQFDKLSLNTGQANLIGTTMKLKEIADKKKTAAAVQNAILDTASEMGLESDALAKGKIKYAKVDDPYAEFGAKLEEFGKGGKKGKKAVKPTMITTPSKDISTLQGFVKNVPYKERKAMAESLGIKNFAGTTDQNDFLLKKTQYSDRAPLDIRPLSVKGIGPTDPKLTEAFADKLAQQAMDKSIKLGAYETEPQTGNDTNWWETGVTALSSALPFIRPSNQIPLDPSQLSGELYSLSQNQEEPVFAQSYQPMLSQGINISLQDQLNEITSQARSAERMAQGNPAALAMIASQAAEAKNKVLGEQFRMNQGEAQRVAETNRQTINEAAKMNLGLFDQQQQRQAQARSNTKMQNIVALNSINDKIMKQKAENRQIGLMENLYNYRFSPSGVAYNMNPLAQFNPYGSGAAGKASAPEGYEYETILKKKKSSKSDDTEVSRNGSIVKAIKGL